jgi:hypothetical protein
MSLNQFKHTLNELLQVKDLVSSGNPQIVSGGSLLGHGLPQVTASGTVIDFTGIPSWVKRITILVNSIATNGTSNPLIQIGSGSVTSTGYLATSSNLSASVTTTAYTTGFGINNASAGSLLIGTIILTTFGNNTWFSSGHISVSTGTNNFIICGSNSLSGSLDRFRITTVNGVDKFVTGSINYIYE